MYLLSSKYEITRSQTMKMYHSDTETIAQDEHTNGICQNMKQIPFYWIITTRISITRELNT